MAITALNTTLEKFLESKDFKNGVIASTIASWGGTGYSVELFLNGTWRLLWTHEIDRTYETPGKILTLPTLNTDDMPDGDEEDEEDLLVNEDQRDFLNEAFYNEKDRLKAEMHKKL